MRREGERRSDSPETRQGHEILQEAAQLLRQMSFWSNRGAYVEGRHIAISVDPRWDDAHETIQVCVTCYAFGQHAVDWQTLPIFVRPAGVGRVHGVARLDTRGQALLTRLQPDDYRLFVPERYGRREEPLWFSPSQAHGNLAAATDAFYEPSEPRIYDSLDGSVRATVYRSRDGTTVVAFETWEAELMGAVVCFAFVQASGDVLQSATVNLTPVAEEPGLLEARWEAEVACTDLCTFEFGILPRDP